MVKSLKEFEKEVLEAKKDGATRYFIKKLEDRYEVKFEYTSAGPQQSGYTRTGNRGFLNSVRIVVVKTIEAALSTPFEEEQLANYTQIRD